MGILIWVQTNWAQILLIIVAIEKILQIIDKVLPENIKVDNHIADVIARIIKAFKVTNN